MPTPYTRISPSDRPDYRDLISHVGEAVWPEFMLHDAVAEAHWGGLFDKFPTYQFALVDATDAVVGIANSVPLNWDLPLSDLPDEGWDWALIKSAEDYAAGRTPNLMSALQISITPSFQRRGLSSVFLDEMLELARIKGFHTLVAPVRPSRKDRYPLSSIDSYIKWTLPDGFPYDPWLRVHVRKGGRILRPCTSAMKIVGTIAEWKEWTGLDFFESGRYTVPGALVPVAIDLPKDTGTYVEPNVWVVHELAAA